ncbi:exonuclease [Pseudomonas phage VB_PaeP_VL1]|uniref:N4 gp42-like protein n=1 Tax=Pseudomonas phage VB_PaeP_VL1 TaxID=2894395 RepID=A0AAE9CGJ0_9CAUD|nr:exonuclease [Pseudomonas phage VB_PaeP_VL1]UGV19858.1 hypothetical protein vBPaePVL1_62 [Pseudomonas phage VB_PaeP_VL1]
MGQIYTNQTGIPMAMALWLASDYYDYSEAGLSATTLLKPIRQVVLARRIKPSDSMADIEGMIANRMGAAIHDSIEKAWTVNKDRALDALGIPASVAKRVLVNPTEAELKAFNEANEQPAITVYMEQRSKKEYAGVMVSGKYDFVADGQVEDFKSTTTFSYIKDTKDNDYILQGSIYRALNPGLITKDTMRIHFIFTDWQKFMAKQNKDYPQSRVASKVFNLMPIAETEEWITNRVKWLMSLKDTPEADLPLCSDEELWRSQPVYKYYRDPAKADQKGARSTKNFDSLSEAMAHRAKDGNVGVVKTIPGQVKACLYCPAYLLCTQKDMLIAKGDLIV